MRYLNKVIFINSANIKYAEVAIDGNVHFIGTQGVGKSTSLRAILFFYNADKLKLGIEKGKKTFDEYYFPYQDSYLIYEVMRETGPYCIMGFKSQNRTCFRFIDGAYDQYNFIDENGKVRTWDGIRDSFDKVTYTKKIDRYEEYRDILYGNNKGLSAEFRKYSLLESRQYQNLPRTIQNVFLNSKLDAEFIKQTIIMSMNEEDVKIELDKYALHLRDFDIEYADITKWTEKNKAGDIPVRKQAENISEIYLDIRRREREKQDTAEQLFYMCGIAQKELPGIERKYEQEKELHDRLEQKRSDLGAKFRTKREEIQKRINVLDSDLKKAKQRAEEYEKINIDAIIRRVDKKQSQEQEQHRLLEEKTLLSSRFVEISSRYEVLIQQQNNNLTGFKNEIQSRKYAIREELLQFKNVIEEEYNKLIAEIGTQHKTMLDVSLNAIAQRKDILYQLRLDRQNAQSKRYLEEELEALKEERSKLKEEIRKSNTDISTLKSQIETWQKHWELDGEKNNAAVEREMEVLNNNTGQWQQLIAAIDTKLMQNQDSLYGWLNDNVQGWEQTIGKIIDEEQVLFQTGLSPQLALGSDDTLFGVKIELGEIAKNVKTVVDYRKEQTKLQQEIDANNKKIDALNGRKSEEADKFKRKYQPRIKEAKEAIFQTEYTVERSKERLLECDVCFAEITRKAAEEKAEAILHIEQKIETATEDLRHEEQHYAHIESSFQKQSEQKEKERKKKIQIEEQRIQVALSVIDAELLAKKKETEQRIDEIKKQQNKDLQEKGADIKRLSDIEKALLDIQKELSFIETNRDKVAEYNKDKRELFDQLDNFKEEKKQKEAHLETEHEKYQLQLQKLQQEIDRQIIVINDLNTTAKEITEGLTSFNEFKLTDNYGQVAIYDVQSKAGIKESVVGIKKLIDLVNERIYALIKRYNELQAAINKFVGNFSALNIFDFKTNLVDQNEFIAFAEMLQEFLEEDKIAQYEKRVNERFATLIRQIGKETTELVSKEGEIQKVITDINGDFVERNFVGVIKSIRLQLSDSQNKIVILLQEIKRFNDDNTMSLGSPDLFTSGNSDLQNKTAISLLKEFAKEINNRKEQEISLSDSFELQFRIVENDNDSGWVEKLANVGSEGTDILVKAMINIMLLNVFKDSASKRFKDFRLHCMMDEIGKLHPNNVKGILKFANERNILLINSSPTSYNAMDYRYIYLLSKDTKNITTVKRLIKKGSNI